MGGWHIGNWEDVECSVAGSIVVQHVSSGYGPCVSIELSSSPALLPRIRHSRSAGAIFSSAAHGFYDGVLFLNCSDNVNKKAQGLLWALRSNGTEPLTHASDVLMIDSKPFT